VFAGSNIFSLQGGLMFEPGTWQSSHTLVWGFEATNHAIIGGVILDLPVPYMGLKIGYAIPSTG
jgi:hypothetical protein